MKVAIDTNSLLSLVRYYLPFDKKAVLFDFIKFKIEIGEIVIIDKVLEECAYNSKGIVLKTLSYLTNKTFLKSAKIPFKTDSLLAPSPRKFLSQVDNNFVVGSQKNRLNPVEYEVAKNQFLNSADIKLIILCLNLINSKEEVFLVTEETEGSNDNKLFKKIPAICKELNIQTMTLPQILTRYDGIEFEFK
jgi:hypothetical protein